MRIILIIATIIMSGCSSTNGLTVYSFTNSDLESVLNKQLPSLSKEVELMGLGIQFGVNALSVNIGPNNSDTVELNFDTEAEIAAFVFKYPVGLQLQIEGSPYYDSAKKAIFVRNVKLLNSNIDSAGYKGDLRFLDNEVMKIINSFLAVNPVYTLDMDNSKMAFLAQFPLDLSVANGAIKLSLKSASK